MPRDPRAWLFDIVEAGQRIQRFIGASGFDDYRRDELLRSAVERQFEIMGEAMNQLLRHQPALGARVREHRKIVDFRNLLIHGYAEVDDAVVWSIVTEKLPQLIADAAALLAAEPQE